MKTIPHATLCPLPDRLNVAQITTFIVRSLSVFIERMGRLFVDGPRRPGLLFVLLIAGRATALTPAQIVYQASGDYAAALVLAVQYKRLPDCQTATTPLCKDASFLKQIQDADTTAVGYLNNAQTIVRLESTAEDPEKVVAATRAQKAVSDFSKLAKSAEVASKGIK